MLNNFLEIKLKIEKAIELLSIAFTFYMKTLLKQIEETAF